MVVSSGAEERELLELPQGEIPGVVGVERVLSRSATTEVSAGAVMVHTGGLLMTFVVRFVDEGEPVEMDELQRLLHADREPGPHRLVLGTRLADGSGDITVADPAVLEPTPTGPRLHAQSGRGDSRLWRATYWLTPRPQGDVRFLAVWPHRDLSLGEAMWSADEITAARAAIRPLSSH